MMVSRTVRRQWTIQLVDLDGIHNHWCVQCVAWRACDSDECKLRPDGLTGERWPRCAGCGPDRMSARILGESDAELRARIHAQIAAGSVMIPPRYGGMKTAAMKELGHALASRQLAVPKPAFQVRINVKTNDFTDAVEYAIDRVDKYPGKE